MFWILAGLIFGFFAKDITVKTVRLVSTVEISDTFMVLLSISMIAFVSVVIHICMSLFSRPYRPVFETENKN
jgi:Fe2+ transport system protein B